MARGRSDPLSFQDSIRRYLLIGGIVTASLVVGVGGWAATANIAGAVIAPGAVVVESNVKDIQHREGGIVSEILVRNGQYVEKGDLLVRLDDTQTRASREIVAKRALAMRARMARLEAERDGLDAITFPGSVLAEANDPEIAEVVEGQRKVFAARRATLAGQVSQLEEQISQISEQIVGLKAQRSAKEREVDLIEDEIVDLESLFEKNLVPKARITALRREMVRLTGQEGELVSQIAMMRGRISETRMKILQIEKDFQEQVLAEIAEVQTQLADAAERQVAADDQLDRIDIRAPQSGYVHELAVHTVGGVVSPGQRLMQIVPNFDNLVVEARVAPQDVDQVRVGQPADVTFSAFSTQTTPKIHGEVSFVSADLSRDEVTGEQFFKVRLFIPDEEIARLGGQELMPGMPAETFIRTDDRTVLSYLVKPLRDQIRLTFRES